MSACRELVNNHSALRKYFEHAGGHLTADGTDDHLIKLQGVPPGEKFEWDDDDGCNGDALAAAAAEEPEPDDVTPRRHVPLHGAAHPDSYVDDDDPDSDEEDAPPAPRTAPVGFRIAPSSMVPSAAMLQPKPPEQQQLVGRALL